MEMLLCVNTRFASFWPIIHMDPVNAVPVNALFLKPGLSEKFSCILVWTVNLHILRINDAIAPPLDL